MRHRLITALLLLGCSRGDEPAAGGKPLSHWKEEAKQVSFFSFWNSSKDERRREAFRRLLEIGEPAVPVLVELMRDEETPVSGDAFNALGNLGPRAASAVPALTQMVRSNADRRQYAVWVLGRIGPAARPAVATLTPLLRHPDPRMREIAATALAQIEGAAAGALASARSDADPATREAAMAGVGSLGLAGPERRSYIEQALADGDPRVRRRGVQLLQSAPPSDASQLADLLVRALIDSAPAVHAEARSTLTMFLQRGGASPQLLGAVLGGADAESRSDAAWRLGHQFADMARYGNRRPDPELVTALTEALRSPDPTLRIYAARALVHLGGDAASRAVRTIRATLPAATPIIAVRGAQALWQVDSAAAEVRAIYRAGLRDPNEWNRVETISAILEMGGAGRELIPELELLRERDPVPLVRERAAITLEVLARAGQSGR